MKGQVMTSETKAPATPLTAAEIEARKAIMQAADKAAPSTPASVPQNTPSKPAEVGNTSTGDRGAPPLAKATGDAPKPAAAPVDAGKALAAMLTAKQNPDNANKPAGDAKGTNGKSAGKTAPKVLPDLSGKPQGGLPTTLNPHTAPAKAATPKQGGTKGGKAKPQVTPVTAVKAKKLGQRDTALADTTLTAGFNLNAWPQGEAWGKFKPTKVDIEVARALNVVGAVTLNEINLACELAANAHQINVFDVGLACKGPAGRGNGDHKMNVVRKAVHAKLVVFVDASRKPIAGDRPVLKAHDLNGTGTRVCYAVRLTSKGLALAEKAGLKVPKYMAPFEATK